MTRAALVAALALLAGCGPGAPEQEGAERAVASTTGVDEVECTSRSRLWFSEGPPAEAFICAARVDGGFCDRYRAERDGTRYRVLLLERSTSCVLPPG